MTQNGHLYERTQVQIGVPVMDSGVSYYRNKNFSNFMVRLLLPSRSPISIANEA